MGMHIRTRDDHSIAILAGQLDGNIDSYGNPDDTMKGRLYSSAEENAGAEHTIESFVSAL
jgi:hypothetical protein